MDEVRSCIDALGQRQLLAGFDHLSSEEKRAFFAQLSRHGTHTLARQRQGLFSSGARKESFAPPRCCERAGRAEDREAGQALISSGKVGCLILAGGQGTRLGIRGPKGTFPITPLTKKSLFQVFFERALSASQQAARALPMAVMTSPLNHAETEAFFEAHGWFGMQRESVDLFAQGMLPFLDDRGNWLLEAIGKLAEGPDGNGGVLSAFFTSGIWEKWRRLGVEYLNVIVVDNVLADPFDAELVGVQERKGADIAFKCVERKEADEKMGVVVEKGGKLAVVEYSELPDEAFSARTSDGSLLYSMANTSLFCFRMSWVGKVVQDPQIVLPWHLARKSAKVLLQTAKGMCQEEGKIWKFETFLFDWLSYADSSVALLVPKGSSYAPLKNASGEKSVQTVHEILLRLNQELFT